MRANYVANVWKHSHVAYHKIPAAVGFGWMECPDASVTIQWTDGDIIPQQLIDILAATSSPSDPTDESTPIEDEEMIEEDYELDNIVDVVFEDDDEDYCIDN